MCYRADMHRQNMPIKIFRPGEQLPEDAGYATPAQRLSMVWPLTRDAWAFKDGEDAESRLQRHVGRVLRP